ncbi:hypothetical protein CF131_21065 [Aeromonas dhakensis]|nr:hypothetical protein CF131_21065 [Aeromonas dhakensis]
MDFYSELMCYYVLHQPTHGVSANIGHISASTDRIAIMATWVNASLATVGAQRAQDVMMFRFMIVPVGVFR